MPDRMKRMIAKTALAVAAAGLAAALAVWSANGGEGEPKPAAIPGGVPLVVVDESAGDWVIDRFAGNSTAGYAFSQGRAPETGGISRPAVAVAPGRTTLCSSGFWPWGAGSTASSKT